LPFGNGGCCWHATQPRRRPAARHTRPARRRYSRFGTRLEEGQRNPRNAGTNRQKGSIMTKKRWLLAIVFVDFLALNIAVVYQYGYVGFIREVVSTLPGIAVLVDLTIALSLVGVWMWNDAKRRGVAVVPYLVAGLFLGSLGPLAYLLRTGGEEASATLPARLTPERAH
jgi:hypothetical protein